MSQPPPPDGPDLTKRPDSGDPPENPYGSPSGPNYGPPASGSPAPGSPESAAPYGSPSGSDYGPPTPNYGAPGEYGPSSGSGGYGDPSAAGQQSAPYGAAGGSSYDQPYGNVPAAGYGGAGASGGGYDYGSPQAYGNYAPAGPGKGLAIASLVLGIIGVLGAWIPFVGLFFGFLGLIGLILGIIALVQVKKGRAGGKPIAVLGVVASIIAMILSLASTGIATYAISQAASSSASSWSSSLDSMSSGTMSTDTEDILSTKLDVTFGTAEITGDPTMPDTRVPITLTNKSDVEARYMITVAAVKNGVETDTDYLTTDTLDPGEKLETEVFDLVIDAEDIKGAEFKVKDATFMPA